MKQLKSFVLKLGHHMIGFHSQKYHIIFSHVDDIWSSKENVIKNIEANRIKYTILSNKNCSRKWKMEKLNWLNI